MPVKGLLQRVQPIAARQTLDCDQRGAVGLDREHQAGSDGGPVAHDRAGAADPVLASDMRPRQPEILAQEIDQELAGRTASGMARAIDRQANIHVLRQRLAPADPLGCFAYGALRQGPRQLTPIIGGSVLIRQRLGDLLGGRIGRAFDGCVGQPFALENLLQRIAAGPARR